MLLRSRVTEAVLVVGLVGFCLVGCGGSSEVATRVPADAESAEEADGEVDERERFQDEVDGVRAVVADCYVSESSGDGRRYRTTVEVRNESDVAHAVVVTVVADQGRGGVSDAFDVPSGSSDAWGVPSAEETTDPVGDVECADYLTSVAVTLDP